MAVNNPYKQGETTYIDTLPTPGVIPGSTIPAGAGLTGATAGAPVVPPKIPITNTIPSTTVDPQMAANNAIAQGVAKPTGYVTPPGETQPPITATEQARLDYASGLTDPETRTPENDQRVKAGLAPIIPDKKQEQVEQDTISDIVKTTTDTGTGGGTGTSGTTPTGGGTTTGGTPTTGSTTTGTGTGTGEPSATGNWQEYFKKATETEFSYNPADDQEYKLAASLIEQQVTDMMVGRGGLYSSVTHSALQSRLMTLQVDYQKMAYEKFKEERDYNMKIAAFIAEREDVQWDKDFKTMQYKASREDEEWNRSFKMAQFKADEAQRKFSNSMQQAQLHISQANAAYNRQAAQAKAKQASQKSQVAMMQADFQVGYAEFLQKVEKWRKQGGTDYELASYFKVPLNSDVTGQFGNRIEQGMYSWNTKAEQISAYARETGDAELYLDTINSFQEEAKPVDYSMNYNDTLTQVAEARQTGVSYGDILNGVLADSATYKNYLGTSGYNKLITDLNRQADQER